MAGLRPERLFVALGTFAIAIIGYVAATGGPEKAWLGVRAIFKGHPAPKITDIEQARTDPTLYYVTIRNPAIADVDITGYKAEFVEFAGAASGTMNATASSATEGGAGKAPIVEADEQTPSRCSEARLVRIPRGIIIEPGRTVVMKIRPWLYDCPFTLIVDSDHGSSEQMNSFDRPAGQ